MKINQLQYKVVFDTNIIWLNAEDKISRLFNSHVFESVKFIKENKLKKSVFLAMPEIVIQERMEQTLSQIKIVIKKIDDGIASLNGFGVRVADKNYKKNYKKKIIAILNQILVDNKVEILKTPKFNQKSLIERALQKIKPFNGDGDKGFKDTLIWLTILEDVKKHKNLNYIFCTDNSKDFNLEELNIEFKQISKGSFNIIVDLKDLKQFLDTELDLKLKLKELYRQVEDEAKLHIGDLMVKFNNQNLKNERYSSDLLTYSAVYAHNSTMHIPGAMNKDNDIVGYDFESINIQDITEANENLFEITANIVVRPRYKKEADQLSDYDPMLFRDNRKEQLYLITFYYDRSLGSINLVSSLMHPMGYEWV